MVILELLRLEGVILGSDEERVRKAWQEEFARNLKPKARNGATDCRRTSVDQRKQCRYHDYHCMIVKPNPFGTSQRGLFKEEGGRRKRMRNGHFDRRQVKLLDNRNTLFAYRGLLKLRKRGRFALHQRSLAMKVKLNVGCDSIKPKNGKKQIRVHTMRKRQVGGGWRKRKREREREKENTLKGFFVQRVTQYLN